MATGYSKFYMKKFLLVCPIVIPHKVRVLFSEVFMDISQLIQYVSRDITNTDAFDLVIPFDCFEKLLNDPVYRFPQVKHIDVICDSVGDLNRMKHRSQSRWEIVHFCTIYDLLKPLIKAELDKALVSSGPVDRSTIYAIISLIEDHLHAKLLAIFIRLSPVLKQYNSKSLHGLPAKNINDFDLCFICPACKLVYQQPYKLQCGHRQCEICFNIQKNCATCFEAVLRDKVIIDGDLQMEMSDLVTHCPGCDWRGSLKDYQGHFKQNHHELITCLIHTRQVAERVFDSPETNAENFFSSLDSNGPIISLNGTCIWEVSEIENIINNATSGQRKSIYSCPFYPFRNGYKMCLRLYINGDSKARNTHMSLFFVIMRGEYDDYLQWPFQFKVTFSLIDQSTMDDNQRHIDQFCWPNSETMCFNRPNTDMNVPYGIPLCFPLDTFKQNQNRFVQKDTMFIKFEIEVSAERPALPLMDGAGELPNDEEHADITDDDILLMICRSDIHINNEADSDL